MKKVIWIVMKGSEEIIRVNTKRMAEVIAVEIGGFVNKYTVE